MKTLSPDQYAWLVAIKNGNHDLAWQIQDNIPRDGEMGRRGLYTCDPDPERPDYMIFGSAKLTSDGLIAIECYQAIHGVIKV
jgi:hypothetical protein